MRATIQAVSIGMDNTREQLASLAMDMMPSKTIATRKYALDKPLHPSRHYSSTLRFQTEIQQQCRPLCMCSCHTESRLNLPTWVSNIIGALFIGYLSTPVISNYLQKCTENSCRRPDVAKLKVDYYFPSWFVGRMIALRTRVTPYGGHEISVRTLRVCDSTNFVFTFCRRGDVSAVREIFSQGLASLFDVDMDGNSPLTMALNAPSASYLEMCRLLLSCYADPEHENKHRESSVDMLWNLLLANPSNSTYIQLKEIFAPLIVDSTENLRKRRFTPLHYSVLNLSPLSLKQQLELSTSNIESKCSLGRTPLLWAVSVCNRYLTWDVFYSLQIFRGPAFLKYTLKRFYYKNSF